MEGTALAVLGAFTFCMAGCADIWQFEDLQLASDAPNPDAVAILDDAESGEAASNGSAAVLAVDPAPNPVEAAVDPVADAASEASCPTCTTGAPALLCAAGKSPCNGQCVNTKSDNQNCGGCGIVCSSGATCHKSMCTAD